MYIQINENEMTLKSSDIFSQNNYLLNLHPPFEGYHLWMFQQNEKPQPISENCEIFVFPISLWRSPSCILNGSMFCVGCACVRCFSFIGCTIAPFPINIWRYRRHLRWFSSSTSTSIFICIFPLLFLFSFFFPSRHWYNISMGVFDVKNVGINHYMVFGVVTSLPFREINYVHKSEHFNYFPKRWFFLFRINFSVFFFFSCALLYFLLLFSCSLSSTW